MRTRIAQLEESEEKLGRAKAELREREERYRILFEAGRDAVFILKEDRFIDCNSRTLEMFKCTREQILGESPYRFSPKHQSDGRDSRSGALERINAALKGEPQIFEWCHIRYDKTPFHAEVFLNAVEIAGETFLQAIVRDISVRRAAEKEKLQLEEKLIQAEKMEAIGRLAGGVAHDLNNVLSAVVGYPDLLLMKLPADSDFQQSMLTIQKSGQKAAAIVDDLLTLARRGVRKKQVVDLNTIVYEYLNSPEYETLSARHPHVRFETDFENDLLPVLGSPVHLTKTIMNLVSNAAEAIPGAGRGVVTVSTLNLFPGGTAEEYALSDYVVLTVSDNGAGIAPEDIKRIFEPFYTRKVMGRSSGTGLGMAVVWGTVQDHGGYINVSSRVGKGTTFELYFPVTREAVPVKAPRLLIEEYLGNGQKIVVVDDVEGQREILSLILGKLKYEVCTFATGEAAVEYVADKGNVVDLVILDMLLGGGLDGLDTYRGMVAVRPGLRALIVSGFSDTERVEEARQLGAGEYIKKPFTMERIGLAVKKELEKGKSV
ncbi:MAG: response regulator [bacterium]|nr:response regulator [bacterium]